MSESRPWVWEREEHDGEVPVTTLRGPDVLCRYWDSVGWNGKRDASVIGAAQKMLEALKGIRAVLVSVDIWPDEVEKLDAAIAEAEGQTG